MKVLFTKAGWIALFLVCLAWVILIGLKVALVTSLLILAFALVLSPVAITALAFWGAVKSWRRIKS